MQTLQPQEWVAVALTKMRNRQLRSCEDYWRLGPAAGRFLQARLLPFRSHGSCRRLVAATSREKRIRQIHKRKLISRACVPVGEAAYGLLEVIAQWHRALCRTKIGRWLSIWVGGVLCLEALCTHVHQIPGFYVMASLGEHALFVNVIGDMAPWILRTCGLLWWIIQSITAKRIVDRTFSMCFPACASPKYSKIIVYGFSKVVNVKIGKRPIYCTAMMIL